MYYLYVTCHSATWDYNLLTSPHPTALLRPPGRCSLYALKSLRRSSQSVRPSTAALRLPAHMRAARSQTVRGIYFQEWDNTPDYEKKRERKKSLSLVPTCCHSKSFLLERRDRHAAIMSRAPEDVTKITESTYKVSGSIIGEYRWLTGAVRGNSGFNFVPCYHFHLGVFPPRASFNDHFHNSAWIASCSLCDQRGKKISIQTSVGCMILKLFFILIVIFWWVVKIH